jgi:hypothetical protein
MADCRACGGRGVASSDGWPDVADSSKLAVWEHGTRPARAPRLLPGPRG